MPLPWGYICIKSLKMCIIPDLQEIILKLVCPCPGAIFMYKSIKIYTRTRCQVSIYRTTGPLVCFVMRRLICVNCIYEAKTQIMQITSSSEIGHNEFGKTAISTTYLLLVILNIYTCR